MSNDELQTSVVQPELTWKEAIIKVLQQEKRAMHYEEIAEQIGAQQLRTSLGATPASSVNTAINLTLKNSQDESPFIKVDRGTYALRTNFILDSNSASSVADDAAVDSEADEDQESSIVTAFGMYWRRDLIIWNGSPKLLGRQSAAAEDVDFSDQVGIYLLGDSRGVIYVGQAVERSLVRRLLEHTRDRHAGRWDWFSWFGLKAVHKDGTLSSKDLTFNVNLVEMANTLEAILIEAVEPRQNRKRGNDFGAFEYIQVEDPELKRQRQKEAVMDLLKVS